MSTPKYRLEIYLPLLTNPDVQGRRKKQPVNLLKRTRDEIREYFRELGLTIDMGTIGIFKGQVEEQHIIQIDVSLSPEDVEWLKMKKKEWAQRFGQEEIYIIYYPITVIT
jgi:hypothetical protein